MRRLTTTSLFLAFLLALLAPVQAAWSCPDGTPCVHDRSQGFVCAEQECADHASSCCVVKTVRCKHGETPSVGESHSKGTAVQAPDHCRYSVSATERPLAASDSARLLWTAGTDVPPLPLPFQRILSPARPVWQAEFTLGYRPPPLLTLGPSRAPPFA